MACSTRHIGGHIAVYIRASISALRVLDGLTEDGNGEGEIRYVRVCMGWVVCPGVGICDPVCVCVYACMCMRACVCSHSHARETATCTAKSKAQRRN